MLLVVSDVRLIPLPEFSAVSENPVAGLLLLYREADRCQWPVLIFPSTRKIATLQLAA